MTKDSYEFAVTDRSILLPFYARWVWDPITNRLPIQISPNSLTIWANVAAGLAYAGLLLGSFPERFTMALAGIGIFVYFTLDNVDGRQARRTGQTSALGEFLDHWFDAWNVGLLVLCVGGYLRISEPFMMFTMVSCSLGFFATYWEQYQTGRVQLGHVGPNEGLTAVSILLIVGSVVGKAQLSAPVIGGASLFTVFCALMSLGFLVVVASVLTRLAAQAFPALLGLLACHALALGWYFEGVTSATWTAVIMVGIHVEQTGRVLSARLRSERYVPIDGWTMAWLLAGLGAFHMTVVWGHGSSSWAQPLARCLMMGTILMLMIRVGRVTWLTWAQLRPMVRFVPLRESL